MNANLTTKTIELTKSEAKAAGKLGTDAFKALNELRAPFPEFQIEVKHASKKKSALKGLNYDYMKQYIKTHDASAMAEFDKLRGYEDGKKNELATTASFGEVKAWFLLKFPEIKQFNEEIEQLRETVRERNEAQKAVA